MRAADPVKRVRSVEKRPLEFKASNANEVTFEVDLDLSDIILIE